MWEDEGIEAEFALARDFVRGIRESRAQHALPPSKRLAAVAKARGRSAEILTGMRALVGHLAGLESLEIAADAVRPETAVSLVVADVELYLAGVIDPAKERERLLAKKAKLAEEAKRAEVRLSNEGFVGRAPAEVVEKERQRLRELLAQIALIDSNL